MVTSILVRCPNCGPAEITPDELTVWVDPVSHTGQYSFICRNCGGEEVKPAQPRTVDLLLASGVKYCTTAYQPETAAALTDLARAADAMSEVTDIRDLERL